VKTIRIWLLVLLAVLLPLRGVVAAAMPCQHAGVGDQRAGHLHAAPLHAAHQQAAHEHGAHPHAPHGPVMAVAGEPHAGGVGGQCTLCCDFCSVTPLASTPASVAAPLHLSSVSFPDLFAPAPSFFSDGQERPPRST